MEDEDVYISPLILDSPFKKNASEIEAMQFQGAEKRSFNGVDVIADKEVNPHPFIQEMYAYLDVRNDDVYAEGVDKHVFDFNIKVFISKDDSYLRKLFQNTEAADDEVILFLEDNTDDIISGSSAYVKVGQKFREELKRREIIGKGQAGLLEDEKFKQHFQNASLDFTDDQIRELIVTGEISNISQTVMIGILQAAYILNIVLTPVFGGIADGIKGLTDVLKKHIKFQSYHWDPEAKKPDPNDKSEEPKMIDNPDFEPVLFPYSNELVDELSELGENQIRDFVISIKQQIKTRENEFNKELDGYLDLLSLDKEFNKGLGPLAEPTRAALLYTKTKVKELVNSLLLGIDQVLPALNYLGKKLFSTVNAFYCGLWNGLMDSIIGIIDLIGLLFRAFAVQGDFMKHAQTKIPQALELLDELLQGFEKIDFGKIVGEVIDKIMNINLEALASKISLERVAYFIGAVVGLIIEIVIGIIFTAGGESVWAVLNKFLTNSAKLVKTLQAKLVSFFGRSLKRLKDDILFVFTKLIEFLKQGTQGVLKAIRFLFDEILKTIKVSA
ncbi:MAG: hypothetical protein OEW87_11840, partial [Flavobacteriaceae bacterium]|nr:hypothetical protein [Flavobacteriaceae bacterium]